MFNLRARLASGTEWGAGDYDLETKHAPDWNGADWTLSRSLKLTVLETPFRPPILAA